jgi:deoxyhypusine monooxygenase
MRKLKVRFPTGPAIPQTAAPRPSLGEFGTIDPAPPSLEKDVASLRRVILDSARTLWERYKALFGLRNVNADESAIALGEALLEDPSALLRHECAFVLGQMQREVSIPYLIEALKSDVNPMVRHESAEALGAIGTDVVIPALKHALVHDPALEVRESCELALQHFEYLKDPQRLNL